MTGRLLGIARRARPRAPMEERDVADVTLDGGVAEDFRGRIKPGGRGRRQVSLLRLEDWRIAEAELGAALPWTTRRANLLVEGLVFPQRVGDEVAIGDVRLRVTGENYPCKRMDEAHAGLMAALWPDWRGGVVARVVAGGRVAVGDVARLVEAV